MPPAQLPPAPLPPELIRYVERPEPTPDEEFNAYLAEVEASGETQRPRPTRRERLAADARALGILVLCWVAVVGAFVLWRG